MNTPVAVVFFNRIDPLRRLVTRLAEVRPEKVYLIGDGERPSKVGEGAKVVECREFLQKLPWPCEVKCNFAKTNMGCRERVTSGLDWVFEQEERAIILEDDCIPEPEFFPWAEKMLERFQEEEKVLSVGGTNLRPQLCDQSVDCTLTKYAMIWGWATWRRAWKKNEKELPSFRIACKLHQFKKWLGKWRAEWYWRYLLTHVKSSWGYRWAFTHFINEAYCVLPPVNLVENIGMTDEQATHTNANPYELPLVKRLWKCPDAADTSMVSNRSLDSWIEDNIFSRSMIQRVRWVFSKAKK